MNSFLFKILLLILSLLFILGCDNGGGNDSFFLESSNNTPVSAPPQGTGGALPNFDLVAISLSNTSSPAIVELGDSGIGIEDATGFPLGGVFSLANAFTANTGGTFSIDPTTGVVDFTGANSSGLATVDVVYTAGNSVFETLSVIVPLSFNPSTPGVAFIGGADLLGVTIAEGFPLGGTYAVVTQSAGGTGGTFVVDALTGSVDFIGPFTGTGTASVTLSYTEASIGTFSLDYTATVSLPPSVTSCTPAASGDTATITGTSFSPSCTVTLGGTSVTVTAATATTIDFTVPAETSPAFSTAYTVDIVVTNPAGPVTSGTSGAGAFTLIKEPDVGELFINEILFNAPGSTEASFEYVEFVNVTDAILNLAGCTIGDGPIPPVPAASEGSCTFGSAATDSVLILPAGYSNPLPVLTGTLAVMTDDEFFVFIGTEANLSEADLGGTTTGVTATTGFTSSSGFALFNSGDAVTLVASDGTTIIDAVAYTPGVSGFPASTDGVAIELISTGLSNDVGSSWILASGSTFTYPTSGLSGTGTPGSPN